MLNEEAQVAAFLMVSLVLLDPVSTVEYVKGERIGTRLLQSSTKDRPVSPALWAQVFSDHDFKFATCTEMFCKLGTQSGGTSEWCVRMQGVFVKLIRDF